MDTRRLNSVQSAEERRIEAMRERHEKLWKRLLCPNIRLTGRDQSALNDQIQDKQRQKEQERKEEEEYAQHIHEITYQLHLAELDQKDKKRQQNQDLRNYWLKVSEDKAKQRAEEKAAKV